MNTPPGADSSADRVKVLIVDDSEFELKVARKRLEDAGYQVISTSSGNCAHLVMRERPDLILMDVSMPGLQGDLAARMLLLSQSNSSSTVIVLHSRLPEEELAAKVKATGVAGYIAKTQDTKVFLKQVGEWAAMAKKKS
jgi:CheY-like chemotaxis protein